MNAQVEIASATVLAIVLTLLFFVLLQLVRRSRSRGIRVLAAASLAAALVTSPCALDILVTKLNRTSGVRRVMIDPGLPIRIAPGLVAVVLAAMMAVRTSRP